MKTLTYLLVATLFINGLIAQNHKDQNQLEQELKVLNASILNNPNNPDYYWQRIKVFENYAQIQYIKPQEYQEQAVQDLDKMIALGAVSFKVWTKKGDLLIKLGNQYKMDETFYKPAESEGWQDEKEDQNQVVLLKQKAINAFTEASEAYQEALKIEPTSRKVETALELANAKIIIAAHP